MKLVAGLADGSKLRLERSATDQEAIDVGLLSELLGVAAVDGATVDDTDSLSFRGAEGGGCPLADEGVDVLGLLGSGGLAGPDSPDGLVGNDSAAGPLLGDELGDGLELSTDDLLHLAGLTLLEGLTDAEDDLQAGLEGSLCLFGNHFVRLAEVGAALGVAEDHPGNLGVGQLGGGNLTGEGTGGLGVGVLGTNLDLLCLTCGGELGLHVEQVEERGGDDNLGRLAEVVAGQGSDQLVDRLDRAVHLPVAADEEGARHFGQCGCVVGWGWGMRR